MTISLLNLYAYITLQSISNKKTPIVDTSTETLGIPTIIKGLKKVTWMDMTILHLKSYLGGAATSTASFLESEVSYIATDTNKGVLFSDTYHWWNKKYDKIEGKFFSSTKQSAKFTKLATSIICKPVATFLFSAFTPAILAPFEAKFTCKLLSNLAESYVGPDGISKDSFYDATNSAFGATIGMAISKLSGKEAPEIEITSIVAGETLKPYIMAAGKTLQDYIMQNGESPSGIRLQKVGQYDSMDLIQKPNHNSSQMASPEFQNEEYQIKMDSLTNVLTEKWEIPDPPNFIGDFDNLELTDVGDKHTTEINQRFCDETGDLTTCPDNSFIIGGNNIINFFSVFS